MRLEGKVALVTGAGKGIGKAIALTFAEEGADIGVNALHLSSAEAAAGEIRKLGQKVIAIEADVSNADDVDRMVGRVLNELGGVDILVNNAGISLVTVPTVEQPIENWDRVVSVNMRGAYLCSRRVGKWMVSHRTGKVVNIASMAGLGGTPVSSGYGPSKAGMINLTEALAVEWAKYNINVNCIAPGFIMTRYLEESVKVGRNDLELIKRRTPLGRVGEPKDIANAALFLVSDDASYITGSTLRVDGGWVANIYYKF